MTRPRLEYAALVWSPIYNLKTDIRKLERMQRAPTGNAGAKKGARRPTSTVQDTGGIGKVRQRRPSGT